MIRRRIYTSHWIIRGGEALWPVIVTLTLTILLSIPRQIVTALSSADDSKRVTFHGSEKFEIKEHKGVSHDKTRVVQ